jgi:hypothetical protein
MCRERGCPDTTRKKACSLFKKMNQKTFIICGRQPIKAGRNDESLFASFSTEKEGSCLGV